jgi:hypothetical protein
MNLNRLTGQCGRLKCCIAFEDGCDKSNDHSCDSCGSGHDHHFLDDNDDDLVGYSVEDDDY